MSAVLVPDWPEWRDTHDGNVGTAHCRELVLSARNSPSSIFQNLLDRGHSEAFKNRQATLQFNARKVPERGKGEKQPL